jgi:hypothetical protein
MKRDWTVPDVPCDGDGCTPEHPTCDACVAGKTMMMADGLDSHAWEHLSELARESWRIEAADA